MFVGLTGPLAVRSSAVGEDGADASFAGQHLTLLNVPSSADISAAIRQIWWSANSDSAITYRKRVGLFDRPSVGVVVQALLNPEVAGVMFTQNPINGTDERVIEASWGLAEPSFRYHSAAAHSAYTIVTDPVCMRPSACMRREADLSADPPFPSSRAVAHLVATVLRFPLYRSWVFRGRRAAGPPAASGKPTVLTSSTAIWPNGSPR